MDYEDLSAAGQSTPAPASRPASGTGGGPTDTRRILLLGLISGLVLSTILLIVVGLPYWMIAVFVVAEVVAIRVMYSKLPPST